MSDVDTSDVAEAAGEAAEEAAGPMAGKAGDVLETLRSVDIPGVSVPDLSGATVRDVAMASDPNPDVGEIQERFGVGTPAAHGIRAAMKASHSVGLEIDPSEVADGAPAIVDAAMAVYYKARRYMADET